MTHEESLQFAKKMNTVMKKIYNLGFEDFMAFMEATMGWKANARWLEEKFLMMREDFFRWWVSIDANLQAKMVEHALSND